MLYALYTGAPKAYEHFLYVQSTLRVPFLWRRLLDLSKEIVVRNTCCTSVRPIRYRALVRS